MYCRPSRTRRLCNLLLPALASLFSLNAYTQSPASQSPDPSTPLLYTCQRTNAPLTIDGKGEETAWRQAAWTLDFQDIESSKKPFPNLRTRVKMLWDDQYLYLLADIEEPHIWARLQQHDTIIYHDNDFEVFIDPDGDTHQYYELEINAYNTVMDLFMPRPYRNGGNALLNWDAKGVRTAVHINGTINNPSDIDKGWSVEIAIPFHTLGFYNQSPAPRDGQLWRINFSRVQWDTDIRNGQYIKRQQAEHNWVWSPQGIIDMHAPEKWGYLHFSRTPAGTTAPVFRLPEEALISKYLWQVYYGQQTYRRKQHRFATQLSALNIPATITDNGKTYQLTLEAIKDQYTATLQGGNMRDKISINQEGKISPIK
ncbi:carbohydrate-binding family 9-like protein [Chitinophaga pendula]|uniref:carbohydrate-binding family 9-like protein n=1 Tax=Chitinophaga TaxID=79328 RepID=UPI000BB08791|nr:MULTISPECIES: carbohydrate-binding family 9-like protein [Chitinophaga]ASZ10178.1 carbohydrate-binding family 9-like protein [Chitinophaga sp. MD30]UCJ06867.1 carbohydrate-binding family 9-like protein [Chitinophaga pendula]